jgi:hypothetical protein
MNTDDPRTSKDWSRTGDDADPGQHRVPREHEDSREALRERVRDLDHDITELRKTAEDIRFRISRHWEDPMDEWERGAMIQRADEVEAQAEELELKREGLLRRLRQLGEEI